MMTLTLLLSTLSAPLAAWAADDGLPPLLIDEAREDRFELPWNQAVSLLDSPSQETPPAADVKYESHTRPLTYIIQNSRFEAGFLFLDFDDSLDVEADSGIYARWEVGMGNRWNANLTYRFFDFENSALPGPEGESIQYRGALVGVGFRQTFGMDFAFSANGAFGLMRFLSGSHEWDDETVFVLSAEAAVTARIHETISLRLGAVFDHHTGDFHDGGSGQDLGLLLGVEIGARP